MAVGDSYIFSNSYFEESAGVVLCGSGAACVGAAFGFKFNVGDCAGASI